MSEPLLTPKGLGAAVRKFFTRASRPRKKGECKSCKKLRQEIAPILATMANMLARSDVVIEDMRTEEAEAAIAEWMAAQAEIPSPGRKSSAQIAPISSKLPPCRMRQPRGTCPS